MSKKSKATSPLLSSALDAALAAEMEASRALIELESVMTDAHEVARRAALAAIAAGSSDAGEIEFMWHALAAVLADVSELVKSRLPVSPAASKA